MTLTNPHGVLAQAGYEVTGGEAVPIEDKDPYQPVWLTQITARLERIEREIPWLLQITARLERIEREILLVAGQLGRQRARTEPQPGD
jgi:hypothetical protein